jgi:hypothetical protein
MWTAFDQIGLRGIAPATGPGSVASPTQVVARTDDDTLSRFGVDNPLVWLGAFLLVTVGAASVAGSVRLGKVKVSASAGK